MTATRYVIVNDKGEFYFKGETSSLYGFTPAFNDAFLFKTTQGAEKRKKLFKDSTIMEVEITLKK